MNYFGLVGKSGFGREVMPILAKMSEERSDNINPVYVDVDDSTPYIGDIPVIEEKRFLEISDCKKFFNVAIADSKIRKKISEKYESMGCIASSIVANNATILDRVNVGKGSIICSYSHLTSDIYIGKYFHCNIYSYVAHDCVIGDYVTFAPKVCCNGNVTIEDYAYIGTGSVIKQGDSNKSLVIGEGAIVGMGAVVTKDVAPYSVVVGNPARPLVKP